MRRGVIRERVLRSGEAGGRVGKESDNCVMGWRMMRRLYCQSAYWAIRRAVECGERERG